MDFASFSFHVRSIGSDWVRLLHTTKETDFFSFSPLPLHSLSTYLRRRHFVNVLLLNNIIHHKSQPATSRVCVWVWMSIEHWYGKADSMDWVECFELTVTAICGVHIELVISYAFNSLLLLTLQNADFHSCLFSINFCCCCCIQATLACTMPHKCIVRSLYASMYVFMCVERIDNFSPLNACGTLKSSEQRNHEFDWISPIHPITLNRLDNADARALAVLVRLIEPHQLMICRRGRHWLIVLFFRFCSSDCAASELIWIVQWPFIFLIPENRYCHDSRNKNIKLISSTFDDSEERSQILFGIRIRFVQLMGGLGPGEHGIRSICIYAPFQ